MTNNFKKNICQDAIGNVSDKVKAVLFVMSMICGAVASSDAMDNKITEEVCRTMSTDDAILTICSISKKADMLIKDGKIIEQNVPLVAKICERAMFGLSDYSPKRHKAMNLLNFLGLEPNHMTACLNLGPEEAVALILGKSLNELLEDGYYREAAIALENVNVAAELQDSDAKIAAVRELIDMVEEERVEEFKLRAKAALNDDDDDSDDDNNPVLAFLRLFASQYCDSGK